MTDNFDNGGSDPSDSPLAGILSEAMSRRQHQLRPGQGSIHDVRMRARRITRRRTAVGAGALVAVGAVGVIAVARNGDGGGGQRLVAGSGEGPGDDDATAGPDGGYWECTGPLGIINSASGVADVYPTMPASAPLPGPTTTWVVSDTTSTVLYYATTTVAPDPSNAPPPGPFDPTTTFPFDPTSTTVDLSASTSTLDPGLATATSLLRTPIEVPSSNGGVFYMQDCTHVDGSVPVDPTITATTYPAGLSTDTVVAGTELNDPAANDPAVTSTVVDQATTEVVVDTTAPAG